MPRSLAQRRTPTRGLLLALVVILCSVLVYSRYIRIQITHLRQVQSDLVDRNRRDSLQLLRIQNNLNALALAMRDMLQGDEPYPLSAWQSQFRRLRVDLDDALQQRRSARRCAPHARSSASTSPPRSRSSGPTSTMSSQRRNPARKKLHGPSSPRCKPATRD